MWRYNYTSDAYCKNHNCFVSGAKPVNVNSGSGSTLSRKAGTKYSKKLNNSNGNFSLNSSSNQSYIGNPNSNLSYLGCKQYDKSIKSSVKNYSGLRGTRLVNSDLNNGIKCNPVNSYQCYVSVNNNNLLNKHNLYEKDQSRHLDIKKSACSVDRSNYLIDIANNTGTNNCITNHISGKNKDIIANLTKNCNVTKDMNKIQGYTMGYDLYINDKVKKGCSHNPRDARVIAC
tara:strand:- start:188 stop:877 length:690 start_codon:yes stop_codon:yes gene_type:complete